MREMGTFTGHASLLTRQEWRLLVDPPSDPWWNMGVDEAITADVAEGKSPPTLRLYRWDRPAVSVGRFQDVVRGIDAEYCRSHQIPIVRRPTGGRGILHGGDQTVSVVVPEADLGAASKRVVESYRLLSRGFESALGSLGLTVRFGSCESATGARGDCFAVRSAADMLCTSDGAKIVGSAQRRIGGVILQQSSILHRLPPVEHRKVFRGPTGASKYPLALFSEEKLRDALIRGFGRALGIRLVPRGLSKAETEDAERMALSAAQNESERKSVDSRMGI